MSRGPLLALQLRHLALVKQITSKKINNKRKTQKINYEILKYSK